MEPWHIWIIVALVFFILEIFTSGFAVACFSVGALASSLGAALHVSLLWQMVIFAAVSLLALVFVRPVIMKVFYKPGEETKTNTDALLGREGRVSESIDPQTGKGRVAIDGDDWKAVSQDGSALEMGTRVRVVSRDGVTVTVIKL